MGAGAARGEGRIMPERRPLRPEIQGLRAVAVALVVVHHLARRVDRLVKGALT